VVREGAAFRALVGGRKQFFFEKKNQKTFISRAKVFCFFFSKKNHFLPFLLPLAEPALTEITEAVRARKAHAMTGDLITSGGWVPVTISVVPTGLATPAAVLRLVDLRSERALQAQVAQAQRLQAVGQLAGGIAHDFNNLLTAIAGAADDLGPRTAQAGQEDLEQIRTSAARGAALVRQLLAFGGQQTLLPRIVALNDAVRSAVPLLQRLLGTGITLRLELEEPGRIVKVDPTQLDQVLVNLAVNARDAMIANAPGAMTANAPRAIEPSGTLTISTGRRLLLQAETDGTQTLPPGRYATLDVRDTGGGIPPEVLPRIFEPFFTTKRESGGTGLGLCTVHGIVRQSGGFLSVQSEPGQGTCFRLTLPRHEVSSAVIDSVCGGGMVGSRWAEAHATIDDAPAPPAPPCMRLLLVDDEDAVRRVVARALRRGGWDVIEACGGAEALEDESGPFALLVSDVMMPGVDGLALVHAMRERQPGLHAILVSGYADAAQRKALARDDIAFLAKPFAMADLVGLAGRVTRQQADAAAG
jgi:two-component system cell cycle sensor histidine kinase/response regulator CckA